MVSGREKHGEAGWRFEGDIFRRPLRHEYYMLMGKIQFRRGT